QTFGNTLSNIAEAIPAVVGKIMEFAGKISEWKEVLNDVMSHFQPFREAFMNAIGNLVESFAPMWENLKSLFQTLEPILVAIGAVIGGTIVTAFGLLTSTLNAVISALGPFINALINAGEFVVQTFMLIVNLLTLDFPAALEIWNQMTETAISFFTNLWDGVVNFFSRFIETIIGFFEGLYNILVGNSIIPDMVNAIVDWFNNMFGWLIDIVSNIVDGIKNGFSKIYETIENYIQMAQEIIEAVWS